MKTCPKSLRRVRVAALLTVTGALAVGLSACGSSSPSSTTSSSSGAASASGSTANTRYETRLALAKCLRAHGLNVPDPSPNGGIAGGGAGGAAGFGALRDQPNFNSAMQACAKYRRGAFGAGSLTPQQRATFQQDLVKFAECMRAHNVNIPDPSTSSGGGFGILRQVPQSERSSPAFQTAVRACSSNLPFRRGGGPGGGGGANPGA